MTMTEDKPTTNSPKTLQVSMTPEDVLAEQIQAIEVHDGDLIVIEVREDISMAQIRAFRRTVWDYGQKFDWEKRRILAIVVPKNTVEVTRLSTGRLDALEQRLRDLENRVGCIDNTGSDPEAQPEGKETAKT